MYIKDVDMVKLSHLQAPWLPPPLLNGGPGSLAHLP